MMLPVRVLYEPSCPLVCISLAMPKSRILIGADSEAASTNTLSGLRSRWTIFVAVRGRQRVGDLSGQEHRAADRDAPVVAELAAQALADQVLHHDVRVAVGQDAAVEDVDDPGVTDQRRRARLVEEPRDDLLVRGELGQQDLDRRLARDVLVLAQVDRAHAPLTELGNDPVAPDGLPNHRRGRLYHLLPIASGPAGFVTKTGSSGHLPA